MTFGLLFSESATLLGAYSMQIAFLATYDRIWQQSTEKQIA
jgi:hypothetical protein